MNLKVKFLLFSLNFSLWSAVSTFYGFSSLGMHCCNDSKPTDAILPTEAHLHCSNYPFEPTCTVLYKLISDQCPLLSTKFELLAATGWILFCLLFQIPTWYRILLRGLAALALLNLSSQYCFQNSHIQPRAHQSLVFMRKRHV